MSNTNLEMAKEFHDMYEKLSEKHGYITRGDTRQFNADLPNGKLMIEVVSIISAKWEAEKLLPLRMEVAMLRDALRKECGDQVTWSLNVEAVMCYTQATAEAYDREHAAKVLERYKYRIVNELEGLCGESGKRQVYITCETLAAELRAANKNGGE